MNIKEIVSSWLPESTLRILLSLFAVYMLCVSPLTHAVPPTDKPPPSVQDSLAAIQAHLDNLDNRLDELDSALGDRLDELDSAIGDIATDLDSASFNAQFCVDLNAALSTGAHGMSDWGIGWPNAVIGAGYGNFNIIGFDAAAGAQSVFCVDVPIAQLAVTETVALNANRLALRDSGAVATAADFQDLETLAGRLKDVSENVGGQMLAVSDHLGLDDGQLPAIDLLSDLPRVIVEDIPNSLSSGRPFDLIQSLPLAQEVYIAFDDFTSSLFTKDPCASAKSGPLQHSEEFVDLMCGLNPLDIIENIVLDVKGTTNNINYAVDEVKKVVDKIKDIVKP